MADINLSLIIRGPVGIKNPLPPSFGTFSFSLNIDGSVLDGHSLSDNQRSSTSVVGIDLVQEDGGVVELGCMIYQRRI